MRVNVRSVVLLAFMVMIQPALATSLAYPDAKGLADHDEATLLKTHVQVLHDSQGKAISQILPECLSATNATDLSSFVVVVELDLAGKVVATWRKGNSELAICFEKNVAGYWLFRPSYAPFFTSFEMNLHSAH